MTSQILAITLVFLLLGGALWWLRRIGAARIRGFGLNTGRCRRLEVVESRALGPGQAIHLVRVGDRALVVAASQGGCALLETRPWSDLADPEPRS